MKIMMFTDIHFGKKRNSIEHNQDCINFIVWMLEQAKDQGIRNLAFLGDWHENRTEINSKTLNYSQSGLELLNDCEWIDHVYFLVGNHDLANRNNREFTSLPHTRPLTKIELINDPIQHDNMLFLPFLFPHEYDGVLKDTTAKYVFGHLEFAGFIMAGSHYRMEKGPESRYYTKPKYIFTGHFHQRQASGNTIYIGNTFPMDFSDADDSARGVCILDTKTDDVSFIDWPHAPVYIRCTLSQMLEDKKKYLRKDASIECAVDVDITYLEYIELRKQLIEEYGLRLLAMKDPRQEKLEDALENPESDEEKPVELSDMNTMVLSMLDEVQAEKISNVKLKEMYLRV